jgi:hypothetical protein
VPRIFELQDFVWRQAAFAGATALQGPDITIDQGRILVARAGCQRLRPRRCAGATV